MAVFLDVTYLIMEWEYPAQRITASQRLGDACRIIPLFAGTGWADWVNFLA